MYLSTMWQDFALTVGESFDILNFQFLRMAVRARQFSNGYSQTCIG